MKLIAKKYCSPANTGYITDENGTVLVGAGKPIPFDLVRRLVVAVNAQDALLAAAQNVPEPEEEGYCASCGYRLELVKANDAYRWQHLPHCWYEQLQRAIREAEHEQI